MKELNCLILLSCVSVLTVTGQSDVIGSDEPVHVTVGHDVILPCHLEPPYDVRKSAVEWRWNEFYVCIYRSLGYNEEDVHENFRGRTSLFFDELIRGNISLKLINVTEQDEGKYSCFVPKLDKRGFINLIVDPEENRNKGIQTDSDQKKNNNNSYSGLIALLIIPIVIAAYFIWKKCGKNKPRAGQDRGEPQGYQLAPTADQHAGQDGVEPQQEENEEVLMDDNVQPDPHAGQDEVEPQEEDEEVLRDDPCAGQDGGRPQEEHEGAVIAGNIQSGRQEKYKPGLKTDSHVRQRQVSTTEEE